MVVRTYSKTWSMAGLRLGYLIGPSEVVTALERVALPYHLDALKQAAGRLALQFSDQMEQRVAAVVAERERLVAALSRHARKGLAVPGQFRPLAPRSSGPARRSGRAWWRVRSWCATPRAGRAWKVACARRWAPRTKTTGSSPPWPRCWHDRARGAQRTHHQRDIHFAAARRGRPRPGDGGDGAAVFRPHDLPARPPRRVRPGAERRRATWPWTPTTRWRTWASSWAKRCTRRSATRPACAGSPPSPCRWTRLSSRWRSTCRAVRSSSTTWTPGRGGEAYPLGDPPFDPQLAEEFWRAFCTSAAITLHITMRRGRNTHHILEASLQGRGPGPARRRAGRGRRRALDERGAGLRWARSSPSSITA